MTPTSLKIAATPGPEAKSSEVAPATFTATHVARVAIHQALDMVSDAVLFLDASLQIVAANAAAATLVQVRRGELRGMHLANLLEDDGRQRIEAAAERLLRGTTARESLPLLLRGGPTKPVSAQVELQAADGSSAAALVAVVRCRGEAASTRRRIVHRDYLTQLPTRAALAARLKRVERQARSSQTRFAVLFVDLDDFKQVNDTRGHQVGDCVLQSVARRLQATVRPGDLVARFGGDEFVVVVEQVHAARQVERIARRIRESVNAPVEVGGSWIGISASVGMAIGDPAAKADDVLAAADRSMYRRKRARRSPR
jgi:diguanylate cyclase (GGDEF)-like protein